MDTLSKDKKEKIYNNLIEKLEKKWNNESNASKKLIINLMSDVIENKKNNLK